MKPVPKVGLQLSINIRQYWDGESLSQKKPRNDESDNEGKTKVMENAIQSHCMTALFFVLDSRFASIPV